jgi:tetratricopeptide (TPR) repeat protein
MEKWVGDYLTKNEFSNNLNDTDTILKNKSGNSLEFAVLLSSLLRAANIPSQIAVGLIYAQNPDTAFSYHFWVKAYIGTWINLDPYYIAETFTPLHITLKETYLGKIEDKDILTNKLLKTISTYKISILNYDTGEKPIANIKINENTNITNVLSKNIEAVNFKSKETNNSQINTISLNDNKLKDSSDTLKLNNYTHDEFIRMGFYNFSEGNIEQAAANFQKANEIVSINDDFSNIQLAKKLASLGLFEISKKNLETITDDEIWGKQINNIKINYFPQIMPVGDNQNVYAKAISAINYQNNPDGAIDIVIKMPEMSLDG